MLPEYKKKQKEITEQNNSITELTQRVSTNETNISDLAQKITENETYINNVNNKLGILKQVAAKASGSNQFVLFNIEDNCTYLIVVDKRDSKYCDGGAYLLIGRGTRIITLGSTAGYANPTIEKTDLTIKLKMGTDAYWYATIYRI